MTIFYHPAYNIDLGFFNNFHPFDGTKFKKVFNSIQSLPEINIVEPLYPVNQDTIDIYVDSLQQLLLHKKGYIVKALEVPFLSFIPFSWIQKKILLPMRWGVSGTIEASRKALIEKQTCWNISGGYHHASRGSSEGFCIYNDIGIAVDTLRNEKLLMESDNILIVDIDAHHGNGNAYTFYDDSNVTLFDIYNKDIYPTNKFTRNRINIGIPVSNGIKGQNYLRALKDGLALIKDTFSLAFIVAGTDVLTSDPLGGMKLSLDDCLERDKLVFNKMKELAIPAVFLSGGGYSSKSAVAMINGIKNLYQL